MAKTAVKEPETPYSADLLWLRGRVSVLPAASQSDLAANHPITTIFSVVRRGVPETCWLTGNLRRRSGIANCGMLRGGIDDESAAAAAAKRDVDVTPLSRYRLGKGGRHGLHLGFAAIDTREIRRGVRELAIALEGEEYSSGQPGKSSQPRVIVPSHRL
jgi:hypothetical protein